MNQFLNKVFLLFVLFFINPLFAQELMDDNNQSNDFQPMFLLGAGYYTFHGDIVGPATNSLVANIGYKAGMRFKIRENLDLSVVFSTNSFYEANDELVFNSDVDAIGLDLGYTFDNLFDKYSAIIPFTSLGVYSLSYKTLNSAYQSSWTNRESTIAIPLSLGLRLDVSERLDFDVTVGYSVTMADIDKSIEENIDNFMSINFIVSYDLFTKNEESVEYIDDYYTDIDFNSLDTEDTDGDLVIDLEDYCPKTPQGVKVDESGCPLDTDNDGIPDYIDKEKDTPKGSVVDQEGVQLTEDKFYSMYADYEAASRDYANFYNEYEIKREDYKTVDEYLIAKANAFNKMYNQDNDLNESSIEKKYMVMLGKHYEVIIPSIINKYLSLEDLQTFIENDGGVVYFVGDYNNIDDALSREYDLESNGFDVISILVNNNGLISRYSPLLDDNSIDSLEIVNPTTSELENINTEIVPIDAMESVDTNQTVYRIQIGAFKSPLSNEIFKGVDNVISFNGKDGWIRYMTGSFTEYKDAVNYMMEMRARGFEDAFIVTYREGERVSLNFINSNNLEEKVEQNSVLDNSDSDLGINYIVQILVTDVNLSAQDIDKMVQLGNVDSQEEGADMTRYFIGTYYSLDKAEKRLQDARSLGYNDAFIFATYKGERISLDNARNIIKDLK